MSDQWWSAGRGWSEAFNALNDETRAIGAAMEIKTRLQHLQFERERLKKAYALSLADIREHEKNLIRSLDEMGQPPISPQTDA